MNMCAACPTGRRRSVPGLRCEVECTDEMMPIVMMPCRVEDWKGAMAHFKEAKKIEPGYCEADYWMGLTLVDSGRERCA